MSWQDPSGLRAPKYTSGHRYQLILELSLSLKEASSCTSWQRVVLPCGKYSSNGNTAHQGAGDMKHPNSRSTTGWLWSDWLQFSVFLSSFSCESRCFPHKCFGQNPKVFTKIALKENFPPFSLRAHIQLATQDCKAMPNCQPCTSLD